MAKVKWLVGAMLSGLALTLLAAPPAWWAERGVIVQGGPDNYAAVNQGQLKHIAKQAVAEMNAKLAGGAGTTLNQLVASWTTNAASADNYQVANIGQVKAIAKPIYDRLIDTGNATAYPWTTTTADDDNYAVANIGQVKAVFSFIVIETYADTDADGIPDAWEYQYFGNLSHLGNEDGDSDGLADSAEFVQGRNPLKQDHPVVGLILF